MPWKHPPGAMHPSLGRQATMVMRSAYFGESRSLLVRFRYRQAAWEPDNCVTVNATRMVLLSDLQVAEANVSALDPVTHAFQALGDRRYA